MRSIRSFLLINLIFSIIIVMSVTLVGNISFSHKYFKQGLDARLVSNALFLNSILQHDFSQTDLTEIQRRLDNFSTQLKYYFPGERITPELFQTFDKNGNVLLKSSSLTLPETINNNLEDVLINDELWRVFSYHHPIYERTRRTFQRYSVYDLIEARLIKDSIFVLLIAVPFLSLLVLTIVNRGLDNIKTITDEVKNRAPTNLRPVDIKKAPLEIKPLLDELNNLFGKLEDNFAREKRFAADAAHELRTPLAALKIQAQVALNTNNKEDLNESLRNIIKSVDRSTHTVNQLLTLSRTLPEAYSKTESVSLTKEARQVIMDLIHNIKQKNIEIELIAPEDVSPILGNSVSISILIKNLIDNAVRYTPVGGQVHVVIEEDQNNVIAHVIDTGPGIPPELREKVFDRFYRVVGTTEQGSGLGLSIVQQIAKLHNAKITLHTPVSGTGLEIAVAFPKLSPKIN